LPLARLAAAALAGVALSPGCRTQTTRAPLVVVFGESEARLDPHLGNRMVAWSVLSSFCDPLVTLSERLEVQPALAERWTQVDATHWRFTLRPSVRFHDGGTLSAADVVASVERARSHPQSALRDYLTGVTAVRAEGPLAVVIETAAPVPDLLNRLAFVLIVPRGLAGLGPITAPVGTGPYRFVGVAGDGTVIAKAWSGWRDRPEIEDVHFEFARTDEAAARRLLDGKADVCHLLPDAWVNEVAAAAGLRIVEQPRLAVQLLGIHPELATGAARRALSDPRVRRAMLLALDRQSWLRKVYRGNGLVASQYVHPAVFGFDPQLSALPHDRDGARRLLAEAGFPTGFDVALAFRPAGADLATAIAADLAEIGVSVRLDPGSQTSALVSFSWACSTGDASDFFDNIVWRPQRALSEEAPAVPVDPETVALLREADGESDRGRRLDLLQRVQRRVLETMPLLPLTIRLGHKGVSARVEVVARYDERDYVAAYRWRR
jgi:peptide/nickel transport system substrate-binding protein